MHDKLIKYQDELDERTKAYQNYCLDYADAKQVYQCLDDLRKTKLAQLKNKLWDAKTEAEKDRLARGGKEYEQFLENKSDMRKIFLDCEAIKSAQENRIKALITLISLEKEKMGIR